MRSFFVVAAIAIAGCVDQGPGPQPRRVEPGYVPKHLLQAAPPLTAMLDVELGGKVVYLGNTVDRPRIIPGQAVKITHYWKVVAPIGAGWQVFTLLRGAPNTADFMNLPATAMQRAHPTAAWRPGEIIEDEQEFVLRPDWRSISATLSVGLIARGAHGVGDRMSATGPHVHDRAVIARVFEVDVARAPPPPGTVHVPYTQTPIVIDGAITEIGWSTAAQSPELITAEGSPEPVGKATAKLTWDDQHLYVYANIVDTDIFSEFKNHDDPLWKQDSIELFIDADNNKRGYIELQVNPNNATFDSWFAGGRANKGDESWDSGMITAVKVRGTPDKAGDADQGWEVEIAIPWAAVKGRDEAMNVRLPPQVGDRWRMNLVRVDKRSGDGSPSASSWNRITYADWHGLDRMLTIVFADPMGGVIPGTPVAPAAAVDVPGAGSGSAGPAGAGSGEPAGAGSGSGSAGPAGAGSGSGSAGPAGAGSGVGAGGGSAVSVPAPANLRRTAAPRPATGAGSGDPAAGSAALR